MLLQDLVGESVKLYILGDTTFGECCVDEIAAEHCSSDGVIHFGHTCLTPTARLTLFKLLIHINHYLTLSGYQLCGSSPGNIVIERLWSSR